MSLDFTLSQERLVRVEVFSANITHNLTAMADAAGIYDALWHSEGKKAGDIILVLRKGIDAMEQRPAEFQKYDSKNGWGLYKNFLPWCKRVLEACEANPDADIEVSR